MATTDVKRCIELFRARDFPGFKDAPDGLYRLRVDRSWHCAGERYTFISLADVWAVLGFGQLPAIGPEPDLPKGSRVRVPSNIVDGVGPIQYTQTFTASAPFRLDASRWHVRCVGFDLPVPVEDLERI